MYGDVFADLDHINQHFARIATDLNYDTEEINRTKSTISDITLHSGDITYEYKVYKILSTSKKTSPGIDGVPYWVYRNCAIELAPVLTHIINKLVNNGTPPSTWLQDLVFSVPKKTPPIHFFSPQAYIRYTNRLMSRVTE